MASWQRTLCAGFGGGVALNLVMLLTFRLLGFGVDGHGILITSPLQSAKLIAVWTSLEPLPRIVNQPLGMILGLVLLGVAHAFLYRMSTPSWPSGVGPRAARLFLWLFAGFAFWEFFTPFNLLGEPLGLIALEMLFWGLIAAAEALVITTLMERGSSASSP